MHNPTWPVACDGMGIMEAVGGHVTCANILHSCLSTGILSLVRLAPASSIGTDLGGLTAEYKAWEKKASSWVHGMLFWHSCVNGGEEKG